MLKSRVMEKCANQIHWQVCLYLIWTPTLARFAYTSYGMLWRILEWRMSVAKKCRLFISAEMPYIMEGSMLGQTFTEVLVNNQYMTMIMIFVTYFYLQTSFTFGARDLFLPCHQKFMRNLPNRLAANSWGWEERKYQKLCFRCYNENGIKTMLIIEIII